MVSEFGVRAQILSVAKEGKPNMLPTSSALPYSKTAERKIKVHLPETSMEPLCKKMALSEGLEANFFT